MALLLSAICLDWWEPEEADFATPNLSFLSLEATGSMIGRNMTGRSSFFFYKIVISFVQLIGTISENMTMGNSYVEQVR